jgi:hypothetical protein
MRSLRVALAALSISACAAPAAHVSDACTSSATGAPEGQGANPSCARAYFFEFMIVDGDGQLTNKGAAMLRARSCVVEDVVAEPPIERTFRVRAEPSSRIVTVDASIDGVPLHARVPLDNGVRVVVGEAVRPDRSTTFVTVVAFASEEDLRREMRARMDRRPM